ncbi:anthranilate synthase component I [Halomarina litorea]|uniref:anthranilate synthase component I n=1 Tax=Halomarina litorea TaxID=2961595 RepID=UPI0020C5463C|nr:anthranilate synthase component I [Halomarina sp. BCD28]
MSLDLSRADFREHADCPRPAVVRATATLDVDVDPLTAYAALRDAGDTAYGFLLESGEKVASSDPDGAFSPGGADRHARYSYVGVDPAAVVTVDPEGTDLAVLDGRYEGLLDEGTDGEGGDVLDSLRATVPDVTLRNFPESDRQRLDGGLVGFLAYDAVYDLWLDEVGVDRPDSRFPDAQFVLTDTTVAFDHVADTVEVVFTPVVHPAEDAGSVYDSLVAEAERIESVLAGAGPVETGGFRRTRERAGPREEYEAAVREAKEHVLDGDIYQGVISRTRELEGEVDPLGLYAALRDVNPSPYMYILDHGDLTVVGASPETLVSVRGREVMANPIAGTCPRGTSPVEDRRLAGEMLADDKERSEHTMLVDLARNDVRRVSDSGSVQVEEFMNVLKYSHVQHIESTVTGRLAGECDSFDATRAAFPAGTLSGAPKVRAMELIDELELTPRGPYGGGVGYYSWTGDADMAIVIRSATVERGAGADGDSLVTVRAGAGIVADSDPASEYEETESKMRGVLVALEAIEEEPTAPAEAHR